MMKHLLVPLDGSELAELALPYALETVAPDGEITLLSVVDVPEMGLYTMYEVPFTIQPEDYNTFITNAQRSTREYLERIALSVNNQTLKITLECVVGEPASMIVDRARKLNVDAIVMSTHGRSGFSRWLFGSITQKVLAVLPCPVLVVPDTTREHAPDIAAAAAPTALAK